MYGDGAPHPWHYSTDRVMIRKLCVGAWENNVYVVACRTSRNAVIVDAAAEPDRILSAARDLTPVAILTTHGHFDHVGAARYIADRLGIPFRLHHADAETFNLQPDASLPGGPIQVGEVVVEAVETPGHTPGSVCFIVDGVVLTGDTLFPGGPGATRGPGSDFGQIMDSVDGLLAMPDETLVMPGHGLDTTIGTERSDAASWRARGW